MASRTARYFACTSLCSQWSQSEADKGVTCSLRRLIGPFASRSTLLFSSGGILRNSGDVGAHLGGHPEILCLAEALFSLLAGNEDSPLSSQSSVCSASVEIVTLYWVSLCCLDEPRLVGHVVFACRGLICIQKHEVLCSKPCASLACP